MPARCLLLGTILLAAFVAPLAAKARPNVLFIAIDDQNDWIGCLGGHPLARTPRIDALAGRGTLFLNAHVQSPLCNPSRTSLMLSLRPTTTGIYGLSPWFRTLPEWKDRVSLPQYLRAAGYRTLTCGKIYHGGIPPRQRTAEFDVWGPPGGIGARPAAKLIPPTPMGDHPAMDWGAFPHRDQDKGDYQITSWAIEQLDKPQQKPFMLAVGYVLPHVPCYVPPRWLEMFPDDDRLLPAIREDDRDDTPRFSWYLHWYLPEPRLRWLRDNGQWRNLCRSYLASVSFMDGQVGRLLDALKAKGLQDDTVIVLWGDNGYHLGEKLISGKNTLWEPSTRVPLVFAGPGIGRGRSTRPAELLDIYPTLVELCGLPARKDLEGHSLLPQLKDPQAPRPWPAITSHNQGNHGVRSERWRYIRYADGSEELYDLEADPHEWTNLAGKPEHASVIAEHRRWLPAVDRPPAPGSAHRILTYDSTTGEAVWEGKPIGRTDPIPE